MLYDQPTEVPTQSRRPSAPPSGPTFSAPHFYANSAPSSSVGFHQSQSTRPPVPLFSDNSTPNIHQHQRISSAGNMAGNFHQPSSRSRLRVNLIQTPDMNVSYDTMGAGLGPAFGQLDHASDMSWDFSGSTAFTSINDPSVASSSTRTVSPKDIFQDPLASAPPSTAFTNLTSPDIGDSPFITDSYDTSPLFQPDGDFQDTSNWFPLFTDNSEKTSQPPTANALERTVSSNSMARSSSSSTNSPVILDVSKRRKSSVNGSPATHASVNGVKPRRRKGPLPPIAVDPSDKVALKRARNTLAARDSRQRKFDHVQTLERRNAELEAEIEKWKTLAYAHGYSGS